VLVATTKLATVHSSAGVAEMMYATANEVREMSRHTSWKSFHRKRTSAHSRRKNMASSATLTRQLPPHTAK